MTLNISVVGKFHENSNDLYDKTDSPLYQLDEDDPNILLVNAPCEVIREIICFIMANTFLWWA